MPMRLWSSKAVLALAFVGVIPLWAVNLQERIRQKGETLMEKVGYSPVGGNHDLNGLSITNQIEVGGRVYSLDMESAFGGFFWSPQSQDNQTLRGGTGYFGVLSSPKEAAIKAFSNIAFSTTAWSTDELASMATVERSCLKGVGRISYSWCHAIQAGNILIFVSGGDESKAIAETLYTNNVLKVRK